MFSRDWGNYPAAGQLPNVSGSPFQTPDLETGDKSWLDAFGGVELVCFDATLGAALWRAPDGTVYPTQPEYVVKLDNAIGGQDTAWNYAMGTVIRILAPGNGGAITGLAAKLGAGGVPTSPHAWRLRRSTYVGPAFPAAATFTVSLASGTKGFAAANTWETIPSGALPIPVLADQWYLLQLWVGNGGQYESIGALRSSGLLSENLARVEGGSYAFQGGGSPGGTPVPTVVNSTTLYGLTSLQIAPP